MKYKEFVENMNQQINSEYTLNERRLRYNKDCGTKARVDEIITNKPLPPGEFFLYRFVIIEFLMSTLTSFSRC